ncbi:MAG: class I SAM-dependent methyltransferase [Bryobacteraceae bacterium]
MNCDPIARWYRYFEYGAFGRELERRRFEFLTETAHCKHALMLGEGDGRFLQMFLNQNPEATVDYVDSSREMLLLASRRAGLHQDHVSFHCADASAWLPPRADYDLIVTHFFLDCFSQSDLATLIQRIASHASQARWIVSDFHQPPRGFAALRATCWLSVLYAFFRLTTGLKTRSLPDHRSILSANGFSLERIVESEASLLVSELWTQCS